MISGTPDSAAVGTTSVTVTATDDGGLTATQIFNIVVDGINEEPTAISLTNTISSINENTATSSRTKVADINISDEIL